MVLPPGSVPVVLRQFCQTVAMDALDDEIMLGCRQQALPAVLVDTEVCLHARLPQGGRACCQEAEDRGQVGAPPCSIV